MKEYEIYTQSKAGKRFIKRFFGTYDQARNEIPEGKGYVKKVKQQQEILPKWEYVIREKATGLVVNRFFATYKAARKKHFLHGREWHALEKVPGQGSNRKPRRYIVRDKNTGKIVERFSSSATEAREHVFPGQQLERDKGQK